VSRVAIVKARAEHVLDDIARVLELAGLVVEGPAVLVPAAGSPFPYPSANTTPWQLEGAVLGLRARGATAIRCATDAAVLRALGVEHTADGAGLRVLLPTMKCDATHTISGATLLAAGDTQHVFALMDGTTAGDGPGPRALRPVVKDMLLASADPVALDAVAATMMGFDPATIAHLGALPQVELVGDVQLAAQRWGFATGGRLVDRMRDRAAGGLFADLVARGTAAYAEMRWPLRDRAVFDAWRDATAWGRLHDRYDALGALTATRLSPVEP
jgi:hypothetical protein